MVLEACGLGNQQRSSEQENVQRLSHMGVGRKRLAPEAVSIRKDEDIVRASMKVEGYWGSAQLTTIRKEFWRNLDSVLPEEIGSVLSPMPISKISFEKSHTGDTDTIAETTQNMFTSAGVQSQLFNSDNPSANALALSIKADQAITYGIVKSIEDAINRFIQSQSFGKNFKVSFLDCSPFNRKELADQYLKACQFGIPMVSYFAATMGLGQAELDSMNFLENDIMLVKEKFVPLQSSSTQSTSGEGATDEGGAPEKDVTELSDSGEQSREDGDDW